MRLCTRGYSSTCFQKVASVFIVSYTFVQGYERPFPTRKALITKIADAYKKEVDFKDFLGNLFIVPARERSGAAEKDSTGAADTSISAN